MMDRRAFVGSLGAFATIPRTAQAQPTRKMYRIGILSLQATSAAPRRPSTEALLRGLSDLGYVYGRDFVTEIRASEGKPERFPTLAAELIRLQVDVILAPGPALAALKQATSSIPVIMSATLDPGSGLRPEPRTSRRKLHRVQLAVARDRREATRITQGSRPRFGPTRGAMGSAQHHRLARGPSRRSGAGLEGDIT